MKTFASKAQRKASTKSAPRLQAQVEQGRAQHPPHRLHRATGNQALQRLPQSKAGNTEKSPAFEPRGLTSAEKAYAVEVFYESVDYSQIRIKRDSLAATFSATTTGNTINLQAPHFVGQTMELSQQGMET